MKITMLFKLNWCFFYIILLAMRGFSLIAGQNELVQHSVVALKQPPIADLLSGFNSLQSLTTLGARAVNRYNLSHDRLPQELLPLMKDLAMNDYWLLYYSISMCHRPLFEHLLKSNIKIDGYDSSIVSSPLTAAVCRGQLQFVLRLIAAQVSVNELNCVLSPPLHFAVMGNNPEMVAALLAAGASVTVQNWRGKTALDIARSKKKLGWSKKALSNRKIMVKRL
jgi:hypothetical protein